MDPSTLRLGYLNARSECVIDAEVVQGTFDLLITVSSWDARCLTLAHKSRVRADTGLLILFDKTDKEGRRSRNDSLLRQFCSDTCHKQIVEIAESEDLDGLSGRLADIIWTEYSAKKKPLRVLMDLSAMSRYHFGFLTCFCFKTALCRELVACYAEGIYRPEGEEVVFTTGDWKTVAIPGLSAQYQAGKGNSYIVSVGFEGWKTLRVLSRAEPNRVRIILPDPGFDDTYPAEAKRNNLGIVESFDVKEADIYRLHAGDAIGMMNLAHKLANADYDIYNSFSLCCGTKPHSFGLVLAALVFGRQTVLYNVPGEFVKMDVIPNGRVWLYQIENIAAV
jgi:hypothetical protein